MKKKRFRIIGKVVNFIQSKKLSDSFEEALALQGIPWILRKLVGLATLSMYVTQVVDDSGLKTITFDQTASVAIGGVKGETEVRVLDWREELNTSMVFGTTSHRSRLINLKTALDQYEKHLHPFLTEGFLEEGLVGADNNVYDIVVHPINGWVIEQVWGFGIVNGERLFIRKTLVTKGDEEVAIRGIYEWKGKTKSG